jgi:ATP:cob(I)alamin adenosyltransferase
MLATDLHLNAPFTKVYLICPIYDSLPNWQVSRIIKPMTTFYTQTGDDGYTGLLGEGRVAKHTARLEAIGTLDEATAALGVARAACQAAPTAALLLTAQRDLYHVMAEVAATPENAARFRAVTAERVTWLEQQTDTLGAQVTLPKEFILPGDSAAGAAMARPARRAAPSAASPTAPRRRSGEPGIAALLEPAVIPMRARVIGEPGCRASHHAGERPGRSLAL